MRQLTKKPANMLDPAQYYAAGRDLESSREWDSALSHYQGAVACMPHILGAHPWFQRYLMDGRRPVEVSRRQTAEVYAAIGRCYSARDQRQNALLANHAAALWHPGGNEAGGLELTGHASGPILQDVPADQDRLDRRIEALADQLTIIMPTNFTGKLVRFKALSPPSTRLITTTYQSMLQTFGAPVTLCPKILCYDRPLRPDRQSTLYEKALDIFRRRHGFEMFTFRHAGLHAILGQIVPRIKTPYFMLVEHDWLFHDRAISLADLVDLFTSNNDVHHVRFNKRVNQIANWDFIMEIGHHKGAAALMKTSTYSNNPCINRTSTFINSWLPACASDPDFSSKDKSGSAMGFEEPLLKRYMQDIRQSGFSTAHGQWGTYIYGGLGDSQRIVHLGE